MDELSGISQDEFVEVEDRPIQHTYDIERPTRTRTLTEKGAAYKIETLRRCRDGAYSELRKQIKTLRSLLMSDATLEEFEAERNKLDLLKENVNEAHKNYSDVLTLKEDKENLYKWFDQCDREFQEFRTRVTEKIHVLERDISSRSLAPSISNYSKTSQRSKGSNKTHRSKGSSESHRSEGSSRSSARERRASAAARIARLEVERRFVDKESEIRKLQLSKEIAMASAEEVAMKKIVDEEERSTMRDKNTTTGFHTESDTMLPYSSNVEKEIKNETGIKPTIKTSLIPSTKLEESTLRNVEHIQPRLSSLPTEREQIGTQNQTTGIEHQLTRRENDASIHDILYLQAKQTELSAMIVEQHRTSLLPLQEPPVFDGNYFDYPVFIRAFEVIIEGRVSSNRDRLYFLNKYTTGKANEVIKAFITSSSESSYTKAKQLLAERYGDPHRVSDAYKVKLKKWPKVKDGDSVGYQEYSDFLCRCAEIMKEMIYMDDLNSSETLKLISGKLPTYSGVRWCRYAFDIKKNKYRPVVFEDIVKFIKEEAELVTDPVFSPDAMKADRKRELEKEMGKKLKSRGVNNFDTLASQKFGVKVNEAVADCVKCLKSHHLNDCEDFRRLTLRERQQFVKKSGLCFGCLRAGHLSRNCRNRLICKDCKKPHPTSLHFSIEDKEREIPKEQDQGTKTEGRIVNSCTSTRKYATSISGITTAAIIPVWVRHKDNPKKEVMAYALLDNASDSTFVKTSVLEELGLKGTDVKLDLFTMSGKQEMSVQRIEGLIVSRVDRRVEIELPKSYSRDVIPSRKNQVPTPATADNWAHLRRIKDKLCPYQDGVCVGVLIGCNCPKAIKPREVITGKGDEPYAVRSLLGWAVIGPVTPKSECSEDETEIISCNRIVTKEIGATSPTRCNFIVSPQVKETINPSTVTQMFEQDFSERNNDIQAYSMDDKRFLATVKEGIVHCEDGHYEIPLPFKQPNLKLPNNRCVALRRLNQLKRRFERDKQYRDDYVDFMNGLIKNGYAEKVSEKKSSVNHGEEQVWYIPHHGVYNPMKPNKIRVVFDCSAEYNGESLNKYLLQGPDLTNSLFGILCRFRQEPVGLMCDIEAMFHQVKVTLECRDYLRFLWWNDGDISREPEEYRMAVHLFGATSSPGCCNYALKSTADDNEKSIGSDAAEFLRKDFFVDDGLKSLATPSEAISLMKETKEMCRRGGFNLQKFISNKKQVIEAVPKKDRAEKIRNLDLTKEEMPIERALGIQWCTERDEFQFNITTKDRPCTRRGVLSAVCSVYDPLGFLAPVLLEGKQILQELCKEMIGWDEPIPESIKFRWERWRSDLVLLRKLSVKRCLKPENFGRVIQVQLHSFSDASIKGYGQCTYIRLKDHNGNIYCSLVMAKARVTPLKPIKIPRLELTAALVSVKISAQLKRELNYEEIEEVFWTNSRVVLGYIANESRRFHTFVANRVQQIQEDTDFHQWNYIESKQNPADLASRGIRASTLLKNPVWIKGPEFCGKMRASGK
jgi:hypothetical protein